MVDKVGAAMDSNEYAISIFIDLSKAFDMLKHKILLEKLHRYGIHLVVLNWFKYYPSKRTLYVDYNDTQSTKLKCNRGVLQGSILRPILFL